MRTKPWLWIVAAVLVLIVGAGTTVVLAFPSVAAITCPQCFGLVRVEDGLYAERDISEADRQRLIALHREANQRVTEFYGGREGSPTVLACFTAECYRRIGGGGERGVAVLNQAVMLSPRGLDPVIASHELSHVELHARLDSTVPQWFDEGLAALVSDDPRYLLPRSAPNRCRASTSDPLPQTLDEWLRAASADEQMYAKAACRVHRWAEAHGGHRAVLDLITRMNNGAPFDAR
ncbi:hypothetical protein [Allokutzneria sp. NRRL B-24872]|uniref:hypothetical protein n=1 Tax=Allokutzneria sp. NRRL B-24872 TaxID=1137961 RepID=UPI0011773BF1|nr:hypothetical protein [Allokutzneria sp. NRRL B-24872]